MPNLDIGREVDFHAFGEESLSSILDLQVLPFARRREPFQQLEYIEGYVADLIKDYSTSGADEKRGTIVCEIPYIDRDYIEDHSVFYSRNFKPYPNYCRRLHFFCLDPVALKARVQEVIESPGDEDDPHIRVKKYQQACRDLSDEAYLGFCVIKPLDGCPVGRTVLRTYPKKGKNFCREFQSTRKYPVHLLGVKFSVEGLVFQQQDAGVAACATTAVWSSLHHLRSFEDVASATPARITSLASSGDLPFGRPMPSEGLSLGQMGQAIQALGVSPSVLKVDDFRTARAYIHSASLSGMAPILVIKNGVSRHAVTVAGVKVFPDAPHDIIGGINYASYAVGALYAHDDRVGPYCRGLFGTLASTAPGNAPAVDESVFGQAFRQLTLTSEVLAEAEEKPLIILNRSNAELWTVTHVLVAMHPKIRLSFKGLHEAGIEVAKRAKNLIKTYFRFPDEILTLETRITRGAKYVEGLIFSESQRSVTDLVDKLSRSVSLPRYLGLIRISLPSTGVVDVLIDTTGTPRNLHAIAVLAPQAQTDYSQAAVRFLAKQLKAEPII